MSAADVAVEVIRIIPAVLWIALALVVIRMFQAPIRTAILPRLSGIKGPGFELSFAQASLEQALEQRDQEVRDETLRSVRERAARVADLIRGKAILWVDDHPENNLLERRVLASLGLMVDIARSSDEARRFGPEAYAAVISDLERAGVTDEGVRFVDELRDDGVWTPVIFYAYHFDPRRGVPPGVIGGTNRPDELVHMVLDALERGLSSS